MLLDHGLYTQLSNKFRYDYSDFWLAIINRDVDQIKAAADKLGVGELYGLFACMVTARFVDIMWIVLTLQFAFLDLGARFRRD